MQLMTSNFCGIATDHFVVLPQTILWYCHRPFCGIATDHFVVLPQTTLCYCHRPFCGIATDHFVVLPQTIFFLSKIFPIKAFAKY